MLTAAYYCLLIGALGLWIALIRERKKAAADVFGLKQLVHLHSEQLERYSIELRSADDLHAAFRRDAENLMGQQRKIIAIYKNEARKVPALVKAKEEISGRFMREYRDRRSTEKEYFKLDERADRLCGYLKRALQGWHNSICSTNEVRGQLARIRQDNLEAEQRGADYVARLRSVRDSITNLCVNAHAILP